MEPVRLGAFDMLHLIRKGGMGEVWQGVHLGQQVPVAIKVMTGKRARHPKYLQAFRNEVQAVAALDHPGIVLIFDHGSIPLEAEATSRGRFVAGSPYLVMELASLGSLDRLRKQLRWRDLKGLLIALLDALAHAHARGVLHRDLKPANVLVCGEGDPRPGLKLTDFGLASLGQADEVRSDTTENMAGTPRYMAPEVFEGRWRDYGPWTDLYAMGCMIYELITRRPLFRGQTSTELRKQHLFSPPPKLRQRAALPTHFDRWLLRLLEKKPNARYQCAADAAWALMELPEPDTEDDDQPGRALVGLENQMTTLLSAITNTSNPSSLFLPGETEVAHTMIYAQQGLTNAETYILPEGGLEDAQTFLKPAVGTIASASTFLFMSDTEWTAVPVRNRPRAEDPPPPDADQDDPGPLEIHKAPIPDKWRRRTSPYSHTQLFGVGLSLFELRKIRLVGRESHRDLIWETLTEVQRTGHTRLVLLEGPSGIGKSRLVEWMCERAHELGAATVMRAAHSPISGPADGLPRMVSRALRCTGLSRADTRRRVRRLLQTQGATNDYEWDAMTEIIAASSTEQERTARAKVIRFSSPTERYVVVRRLLERMAPDKPVILWLDDVQWGSDALWFAQYLLKRQAKRPCPVLLLLTANEEHLEGRAMESHILSQLMELEGTARLPVPPLAPDEHAELVESLLGLEGELAAKVEQSTHGNPLFAIQLVGSWVRRGVLLPGKEGFKLKPGAEARPPEDVLDIWKARVQALIEDESDRQHRAAEAMEIAACLGMDVDAIEWKEACREAGLNLTVGFLQALVQSDMVQPSEGCIAFIHGMARQALEESARAADRWEGHNRACADMLRKRYPADHPGIAERLGRHLLEANDISQALGPLIDGARERCYSGEYRHAIDLLDRREWAMLTLSSSSALVGWGEGWLMRAFIYRVVGRYKEGVDWAQRALKQATQFGWKTITPDLTLEVAHLAVLNGDLELADQTYPKAMELFQYLQDRKGIAATRHGQGQLLLRHGELQQASKATREALMLYERLDDRIGVARCLHSLWQLVRLRGDLSLAKDLLMRARELYESQSHQVGVTRCLQDQGHLAVIRGQFAEGSDLLQRAMAFFEGLGVSTGVSNCIGGLATVAQAQGDTEAAERWWRRAIELRTEGGDGDVHEDKCSLALVLLAADRELEATDLLEAVERNARTHGRRSLLGRAHIGLALAAAERRDWEAWDRHLPQATEHLDHTGLIDPHVAMIACRAAEIARLDNHPERALEAYAITLKQWRTLKQRKKITELKAVIQSMS